MALLKIKDGRAYLENAGVVYEADLDSLNADLKVLGQSALPVDQEILYDQKSLSIKTKDYINRTYAPWEQGDGILNALPRLVALQKFRDAQAREDLRTLESQRQDYLAKVQKLAAEYRTLVAGTNDQIKIASWSNYRIMAERYQGGVASASDLASIDAEISLRSLGETRDQFVAKIINNAARFSQANAIITGAERKASDRITKAKTIKEMEQALAEFEKDREKLR